ncbi:hydrolase, alpha/beta fold family domain protein [Paenarthrobacter aurescens TC1]|uniref:Hydrolase, alpha/beta fold family domain protein n=2 Tax=Paenarthrobacter aurescens TaxID=43663 RepID=A1R612_PAEAT|nr:hydrolase, alpha/beta fold family domain protein [Paenarthrobacter aurescens TC1]
MRTTSPCRKLLLLKKPMRSTSLPPATDTGSTVAERRKTVHGVSLVIRGEGTPVFLMHGIGGAASSCGALAQLLSTHGFQTFCWDAPGYGESSAPPEGLDHPALVLDILATLDVGPAHLIGTSWGGVIATRIAAQAPEAVRSIVLADSTRGSGITRTAAQRMLARVPELAAVGPEILAARRAARLVSPSAPAWVTEAVRADMAAVRLSGFASAATMMAQCDTTDLLPRLRIPALVLVGQDDVITGVAESRVLAENIPGATLGIIPGAGHAAVQEKPLEMSAAILAFWEDLR